MPDFDLYLWVILPVLIFLARVCDVSLATIRLIFISRGYKYSSAFVGFFEVLIWLLAIGQIMKNLSNPVTYIAFAAGFSTGNFVGIWLTEKMLLGVVLIRIVTRKDATELVDYLQAHDYGVTSLDGQGVSGKVKVIFTIVPRREVEKIVELIKQFNPKAFYSIEEVDFVEEGTFPAKHSMRTRMTRFFRNPLRKGK
ncbi:MAG: DUF2179 domain-containing protein [Planctomycetes bacterium]|nr:DUF2179 domain-containing protein [Planctomycetota bacterium]